MGAVYIVEQQSTGARRALKLMLPNIAEDPESRRRFEREAKASALVDSDHVVQVLAAGVDDETGAPWLVMELLEGDDLAAFVRRRGPLEVSDAAEIFRQLGHAIGAAHAAGIVHRDLKPENLFIGSARRSGSRFTVKVLDFGIAKFVAESAGASGTAAIGSIAWMAPEQTKTGATLSAATDVFSLGLIGFWMLTGRCYWRAANEATGAAPELMRELVLEPLPPASERARDLGSPLLPPGFDAWFERCTARDPTARFDDGGTACAELARVLGASASASDAAEASPFSLASAPTEAAVVMAPASKTIEPSPRRGRRVLGALAVVAALAAAVFLFRGSIAAVAAHWSRGSGPSLAAAQPTAITELEPPKCFNPKVLSLYQAACQELRDANWSHARARLEEAAKLEPECAAVQLRLAMTAHGDSDRRASLQRALEHRTALSERDRLLLGIVEPMLREKPDFGLSLDRARAASARFPGDAEFMVRVTTLDVRDPEEAVQFAKRATELDPAYGDAWQDLGSAERRLGRDTEALAALDRCIEASPTSADCRHDRGEMRSDAGQCEEAEADLRQAVVSSPEDLEARGDWIEMMVALGRPRETLVAALEQKWALLPESERPFRKAFDMAVVDVLWGDVSTASARLREAEALLPKNPNPSFDHDLAALRVGVLSAVGETKEAGRVADEYVKRAKAATGSDASLAMMWDHARFNGGIISRSEYEARRQELIAKARAIGASPWEVWGVAYQTALDDVDESTRALASLPSGPVPPAYAGEVGATYAIVGRYAAALPLLRVAACSKQKPSLQYYTARSLDGTGDRAGACKLYVALQVRAGDSPMIAAKHVR